MRNEGSGSTPATHNVPAFEEAYWQGYRGSLACATFAAREGYDRLRELSRMSMLGPNHDLVDVLHRVAQRDRSAFDVLYRATCSKLYGIVLKILLRRSVADEVLQDVYAKIWEKAGDFDAAKASPISWMAAIARNRALDEVRRAKVVPISELPEGFDVAEDIESALDRLQQSEQLQALLTCLANLEGEKREIVLLAYYRGCSREALAQRFSRPVATIKTWLHRSLSQLRVCLAQ